MTLSPLLMMLYFKEFQQVFSQTALVGVVIGSIVAVDMVVDQLSSVFKF